MSYQVLVDLGKLKTLYSGLGQFSYYFGKHIAALNYKNLHWNFLTPRTFIDQFGPDWNYEQLSLRRRYLPDICRQYHIWHAIHQDSAYYPGKNSSPYILTIHDLNFLQEKNRFIARQRLKRLQRKVNRAAVITFISNYTASMADRFLDLSGKQTKVIYNGVDIETSEETEKPGFLPGGRFLFTIGMVLEKKNFHVLVDMMEKIPEYNLVIAGDKSDHYSRRIENRIRKKRLGKRIFLPGIISHEDKLYLYRNCDAFVFPSKMEGFGLPVIEAMRFGKPVFSSTYSSLSEIGGDMAYYWDNFEPEHMAAVFHEKMKIYNKNQAGLSEIIQGYSMKFNWEKSISRYLNIYQEVIKQHYNNRFILVPDNKPDVNSSTSVNTKKIRILHLSSEKSWRGGEQQIAYLIGMLNKKNTDNYIACRKGSEFHKYSEEKGWPCHALDFSSPFDIRTAYQISGLCKKLDIDILHLHTSGGHTLGVLSTYFGHKAHLILTRRVDFPIRNNFLSIWKYNHPRIEKIITVSNAIKQILNKVISDREKCITVHSGININRFDLEKPHDFLKKTYNINNNEVIIGNTSALAEHKDYYTFIDTADILLKKGLNAVFFIIGDGPIRENLRKYIEKKGLKKKVILTGFLSNIYEIVPELDIFLMTSKTEGLGTSVLDAFACKVPVVATRAGGIPEMVRHEETGLLSEAGDAPGLADNVIRLIRNEALRRSMVNIAYQLLKERFTRESNAARIFDIYKKFAE